MYCSYSKGWIDHRRMNGFDFRDLFFYLLNKDYIQ